MTSAKELLEQAPLAVRQCVTHHGCACREYVMARLPDYEAAVDALERLWESWDTGQDDDITDIHFQNARATLRRLRGES